MIGGGEGIRRSEGDGFCFDEVRELQDDGFVFQIRQIRRGG